MVKRCRHCSQFPPNSDIGAEDPQRLAGLETAGCHVHAAKNPAGPLRQRVGMISRLPASNRNGRRSRIASLAASNRNRTQIIGNRACRLGHP